MIVTIHQPEHLPWLGLYNKIAKCEKFVILDSVQYEKNYFQSRNRILGSNGVQWIGIPVYTKGHMGGDIAHTEIAQTPPWKEKYLRTIQQSYGKYDYFPDVFPLIEEAIGLETEYFCDINIAMICAFCSALDIHPEVIRSSTLGAEGLKSELILDICKRTEADLYIAGPSGRDYLDIASFDAAGIQVKYNDFVHPQYPQRRAKEFISHLSGIDLFMNVGFREAKRIIMSGNEGLND